mmetsp:Transcript_128122/g.304171  ORF Transcript_128122/g.304171 Transcript_128122/m.304171 type:complete len:192 (-) Transcript_128122:151-726(-)|eukprot:CAMPEP_0181460898 /NCGR_PEP_ID=MMETSP1110-20121109/33586_1 /TAXON_ID=174948 /ORGANISM="Symbiodinium sp., Strain CCMP421" /LENGTH=191 /DNA_ID=CAMNT_0023585479 /DNA_START=65 /DNA_END=640 /DNA_ORIENTATION=+
MTTTGVNDKSDQEVVWSFGDDIEGLFKVVIRNSFLDVDHEPVDELCWAPGAGRRSKSAPPAPRRQCVWADAGGNAYVIPQDVGSSDASESVTSNDSEGGDDKSTAQGTVTSDEATLSHRDLGNIVELHRLGRCLPCLFHTRKGDGCRLGVDCTYCHLCTPAEAKKRRNRISYEKKKQNRAAARLAEGSHSA